MHEMLTAVREGATNPEIKGVDVVVVPALQATAPQVLSSDAYLLGTPANLGYMSGALKHFFDQIYYPCLDATIGRPYAAYLHGNTDTTGALRGVESITSGLKWRQAQAPVIVLNGPTRQDIDACWELGAAVAAELVLE